MKEIVSYGRYIINLLVSVKGVSNYQELFQMIHIDIQELPASPPSPHSLSTSIFDPFVHISVLLTIHPHSTKHSCLSPIVKLTFSGGIQILDSFMPLVNR